MINRCKANPCCGDQTFCTGHPEPQHRSSPYWEPPKVGASLAEEEGSTEAEHREPIFASVGETDEYDEAYDRGRRDMLNAILSPNPEVARKLHDIRGDEGVEFTNIHGKLSFDLVFWVTAVAEQLGIEPKEMTDDS